MKIYWTKKSIPELSQLSKNDATRLWKQCYKEAMHERLPKLAIIITGLLAGIGCMLWGPIGGGIGGGIGGFIYGQVITSKIRPYLIAAIEKEQLKTAMPGSEK